MQKRIAILGAGESGTGAAILALKKGFDVFVSDMGTIKEKYRNILLKNNIQFEEKIHTKELILNAEEIIKSPGIPDKAEIVVEAKKLGIPVISEIEFAGRYTNAKKICITGSNGKTTTTELTYFIMKNAGFNVGLAGNIGRSFAEQVANENFDFFVLELSSFQLDGMAEFKAEFAILLNITPDHLDRYNYNFQNYIDSKFRITNNLTENDTFIYCADDEIIIKEIEKRIIKAKKYPFSTKETLEIGAFLKENIIEIKTEKNIFEMGAEDLSLDGIHNIHNSMAAGITAKLNEIRDQELKKSLSSFEGVEHRLEKYIKVRGVRFINDSKATNVNSVWYALQSVEDKIVLILGGVDKGNDYGIIKDLVRQKVKAIVALGSDNTKIMEAFFGITELYDTKSMNDAVKKAFSLADEGDVVMLSPACASFDLFENYEDRGKKFKEAVREL
jgi:UDP-N-acetylmuramoylalanine--D-glutamate ligase